MQIRPDALTIGLIIDSLLLHYFMFTQNLGLTPIYRWLYWVGNLHSSFIVNWRALADGDEKDSVSVRDSIPKFV
jgi:hypothetical protein